MAALRRTFEGRAVIAVAAAIGVAGAVAIGVGIALAPARALAAYLAAWCAATTLVIGALAVLALGYATGARWPAVVRRLGDAIIGGLPVLAVLVLPLLIGAADVWPWVAPSPGDPPAVAVQTGWLSLPAFCGRTAIYLATCVAAAECLRAWSRRRDDRPAPTLERERRVASVLLLVLGLVVTFAGFDWLMSLEPAWWSAAFGLYVLTGTLVAGLAATVILAWRGVAGGALPLGPNHFHALGRLLHAFVILWAYIAFFQAMLIQIADQPSEVTFYLVRQHGGWPAVTWLVVLLTFGLPFPLLLFRWLKRRAELLGALGVLLVIGHYVDMWWLVMPRISPTPRPGWTDLAAVAAIGGLTVAVAAWRMHGVPVLAVGDPDLAAGLAYESTT